MSYPGIGQIISWDYTLHHGISPAVATVTMVPQASLPLLSGDFTLTFGDVTITLPDFRVGVHSFSYTSSGLLWRVSMQDKRWRWKYGSVSGAFNLRRRIVGQWDDTLDRSTRATPHQLMALCLAEMRESRIDLSQVPNDRFPEVNWDHERPANALADLAEQLGCRVVLRTDGTVMVARAGVGAELPGGQTVQSESAGVEPATVPDSIMVVGGPIRYQADFLLEPCGLDTDGQVKPINDLSYKPAEGWGVTGGGAPPLFWGIQDGVARQLAKDTVFRWFRIPPKPLGLDGHPLTIPGHKGTISVREQVLPVEDEMVQTFVENAPVMQVQDARFAVPVTDRVPKNRPALVWGWRPSENEKRTVLPEMTPIRMRDESLVPDSSEPQSVPPGGYTIDREFGIVKFAAPQRFATASVAPEIAFPRRTLGLVYNDFLQFAHICPGVFALRCAVSIRDPAKKTPARYTKTRVLAVQGKPPSRSTGPMVIRKEEIVLNLWADRSGVGNAVQNLQSNLDAGILAGAPGVKEQADYYLDGAIREFQTPSPHEVGYAGIMRIEPDGAVQTVSWSISEGGGTTRATRNSEMNRVTIPYKERRFFERVNRDEIEQMRQAARQLARQPRR